MNNTTLQRLPKCFLLLHIKAVDLKIKLFSVIGASLIPFIITVNLLLIFGIIKTKRNKFTPSQILFLTLFVSDLSFGVVQVPTQTYLIWISHNPTCLEIQLEAFFTTFAPCMSGTLLCMISVDRYIYVAHKNYYKKIVTKWSLTITVVGVILTSTTLAILNVLPITRRDEIKIAKRFFAMSAYTGTLLSIAVISYAALLRKVKQKTKNSSIPRGTDLRLTKTIAIIIAIEVVTYFPLMILLSVFANSLLNSTDQRYIHKINTDLLWANLPCQINAIINSLIYLAKNGPMKRYYSKLFNCGKDKRTLREVAHPKALCDSKTKQNLNSTPAAKNLNLIFSQFQ